MQLMLFAAMTGLIAAALVLTAGYLLGAKRGARARERLWQQSLDLVENFKHQRQQFAEQQEEMRVALLQQDLGKMIELLLKQGESMQRMLEPLARRVGEDNNLRARLEQVITPLVQRERLGFELSSIGTGTGHQGDLTRLLDQIAQKGSFRVVILSDDEGLPLASSSNAWDLDRLGGISSFLLVFADRISRDGAPAPLSFMLHDEENNVTLSRIFRFRDKRLLLTAVSTSTELTPTALDPALAKVGNVLSN